MKQIHSTINLFLNQQKKLTLLRGKVPFFKNWQKKVISITKLLEYSGNIGWVLGDSDLVIDVDPRNGGDKSFASFLKDMKVYFQPTVLTPSGGFHIYLTIPELYQGRKFYKLLQDYPGIDFLTRGMQCVIPFSKTEKGTYTWFLHNLERFPQIECPKLILDHLIKTSNIFYFQKKKIFQERKIFQKKKRILESNKSLRKRKKVFQDRKLFTEKNIRNILSNMSSSIVYDDWIKVGMALHNFNSGLKGFYLWDVWSRKGNNYQKNQTIKHWNSFRSNGGITIASLFYIYKKQCYLSIWNRTFYKNFLRKFLLKEKCFLEFSSLSSDIMKNSKKKCFLLAKNFSRKRDQFLQRKILYRIRKNIEGSIFYSKNLIFQKLQKRFLYANLQHRKKVKRYEYRINSPNIFLL